MESVPLILLTIFLLHTIEHDNAEVTKLTNNEKPPGEYKASSHNITGEKKVLTNSTGYAIGDHLTHTEKPSEKHKKNYNITVGGVTNFTEKPTKGQKENSHNAIEEEINDFTNLTDYDIDDVQTFLDYYKNHSLDKKKVIQKRFLPLLGWLGPLLVDAGISLLLPVLFPEPAPKKTTTTTTVSNSVDYTEGSDSQTDTDDDDYYDSNSTEVTSRRKATKSIKKGRKAIRGSENSINVDDEEEFYYMQK